MSEIVFKSCRTATRDPLGDNFLVTPAEYASLVGIRQMMAETCHHDAISAVLTQQTLDAMIVALTAGMSILEVR